MFPAIPGPAVPLPSHLRPSLQPPAAKWGKAARGEVKGHDLVFNDHMLWSWMGKILTMEKKT